MINHNTTEIFFDELEVPAENLIGEEGKGFRYILDGMNAERILIASEAVGDARWFIRTADGLRQGAASCSTGRSARTRACRSRSRAPTPRPRRPISWCARRRRCSMPAQPCGAEANMAKLLAADASWHAGEACFQTHGGFGFAREYDVERKWRETRLFQIAPISTNLVLAYIAEHVLGLAALY